MSSGNASADGPRLKMITAGAGRSDMPSPGTLQRLEDPRAWHARGEVGVHASSRHHPTGAGAEAITLPMAPPLPKGRPVSVKKRVLEEEEYVECLGAIIEGDYFPHNAKMFRALSSLARQGDANLRSRTPGATPSVVRLPTPGGSTFGLVGQEGDRESLDASGLSSSSLREAGTGGALTQFVATHTSEDNEAFAELQEKDQEAFRRRYFWAYDTPDREGNKTTSSKLLILPNGKMMSVERRQQMDAACADRPKVGDHRPNQVETWKHRTRNQLMFSPNLVASNDTCRIEEDPTVVGPLLLKDGAPKSSVASKKRKLLKQSGENARKAARAAAVEGDSLSAEGVASESFETAGGGAGDAAASPSADHSVRKPAGHTHWVGAAESSAKQPEGEEAAHRAAADDTSRPPPDDSDSADGSSNSVSTRSWQQCGDDNALPPKRPRTGPRGTVVVKTNPKVIQAHATRFPVPAPRQPRRGQWASPVEKPSSSRESVAGLLAITGEAASDFDEVPMTPSRVPGVDGDSPQITWGSIDGTPMILDPRATPLPGGGGDGSLIGGVVDVASFIGTHGGMGRQFEMKDLPARDKLAHRLEAVDTRRKRAKLGAGTAADGRRETHNTPAIATPGTGQRTPGTGKRGAAGGRTPGGANILDDGRTPGRGKSSRAAPSTPAARTLAAKLAQRQSAATPFGGGLTPGRQKRRSSQSGRGGGKIGDGLTPLPSTPGRSATQVVVNGESASGRERSSLTDGLLALK